MNYNIAKKMLLMGILTLPILFAFVMLVHFDYYIIARVFYVVGIVQAEGVYKVGDVPYIIFSIFVWPSYFIYYMFEKLIQ